MLTAAFLLQAKQTLSKQKSAQNGKGSKRDSAGGKQVTKKTQYPIITCHCSVFNDSGQYVDLLLKL